jgi:general secretion pathway protein D
VNRYVQQWSAVLLLVILAGCSSLSGSVVESSADIPPGPITGVSVGDISAAADNGRAVAAMPTNRKTDAPFPEIVVRGRETPPLQNAMAGATSGATVPPRPGDITLNFAGADIRDVAQSVLGDMLKLNYVIDPDVTGPITFNISRPVSREELLPTFEAVLNSRGATMTQVNGVVRITSLQREGKVIPAAAGAIPPPRSGERSESFTLRFVSPSEVQHLLEKVLPPNQVMVADDRRHLLVVQGSPKELQLAADTIRIFDIDQLSGMSMALVPLRSAEPTAVTDELKNIFTTTREADGGAIRFMAVDRLNAVMILSRSNQYLDEARSWIGRLDRTRNLNERRVYVYNLQYAKASQVGQSLQGLLSTLDIQFKAPSQPGGGEGIGSDKGESARSDKPRQGDTPKAVPVSATGPSPEPAVARSPAADRDSVRIEADEAHNALLISSSARDYDLIRQVLEGIDVPPLQVLIEVTVAEVTLNDQLNYGVEYFIKSGRTSTLLTTANVAAIVPATPGFALSWVTGNFQPQAILNLLSQVTQLNVISTPRLLVLSNQTARLQVGDVVPIITQSATSTVTSNPLVLNNVTYKETGVVLEVTPRVNAGGFVTMDVNQSVSDVVNTTTSNIDSPTIRQRRLTSTISVKSEESILLGGLIQQTDNRSNSGIPVLSDLPAVGALFGTRNNTAGRTELIMLMTPHVIANNAQARSITAQVEQQFRAVLDRNSLTPPRSPPPR